MKPTVTNAVVNRAARYVQQLRGLIDGHAASQSGLDYWRFGIECGYHGDPPGPMYGRVDATAGHDRARLRNLQNPSEDADDLDGVSASVRRDPEGRKIDQNCEDRRRNDRTAIAASCIRPNRGSRRLARRCGEICTMFCDLGRCEPCRGVVPSLPGG